MQYQPRIWVITDTHLGHDRMIELCDRPKDFSFRILDALRRDIRAEDTLIHLGDVCIGDDALWHRQFHLMARCRCWLVCGNHDHKSDHWYLTHGWQWVGRRMDIKFHKQRVAFSHKPLPDSGGFDLNIHGHFHNSGHHDAEFLNILTSKHRLLAIEYANLSPVTLESLLDR